MIDNYVYFIQCGDDGPIKIGRTRSAPHSRLNDFQLGCPYKLKLMGAIIGEKPEEKRIHALFEHRWIRGEWFEAAPDLLEFITGILASDGVPDLGCAVRPLKKMRHSREFNSREFMRLIRGEAA